MKIQEHKGNMLNEWADSAAQSVGRESRESIRFRVPFECYFSQHKGWWEHPSLCMVEAEATKHCVALSRAKTSRDMVSTGEHVTPSSLLNYPVTFLLWI